MPYNHRGSTNIPVMAYAPTGVLKPGMKKALDNNFGLVCTHILYFGFDGNNSAY